MIQAFHVPQSQVCVGLGMRYRPRGFINHETVAENLFSYLLYLLVTVYQPFSLMAITVFNHAFTCIYLTNYLALSRLWLPGGLSSHDSSPNRSFHYFVRFALYSEPQIHHVIIMVLLCFFFFKVKQPYSTTSCRTSAIAATNSSFLIIYFILIFIILYIVHV